MTKIKVTADSNGVLTLSDKGNSNCKKKEGVVWQPGKGVSSINSVTEKSKPTPPAHFWKHRPEQNGVKFKGTISDTAAGEWNYDIAVVLLAGGNGSIDPKITVNSI